MSKQKLSSLVICASILASQGLMSIPRGYAQAAPYQKTFVITAYYSPLPQQDFYVTGSYHWDKVLNGNGTNGASGKQVFEGMIAAPSTYAFGTQIDCGDSFSGTVEDRGGAIVKAGDSYSNFGTYHHDRLDIWAGRGTSALADALRWGKKTLNCTVYPPGHSKIAQFVNLPKGNFSQNLVKKTQEHVAKSYGSTNFANHYHELFKKLGYDSNNLKHRIAFQMRHGIISSTDDKVAGQVGPQTRNTLEKLTKNVQQDLPPEGLEEGQTSGDVRDLQELLIKLGYLEGPSTAIFGPQTKEALVKFQIEHQVITSADHPAAGYLGPGTLQAFKGLQENPNLINDTDFEIIAALESSEMKADAIANANELAKHAPVVEEAEVVIDNDSEALELLRKEWIESHTAAEEEPQNDIVFASALEEKDEYQDLKNKLSSIVIPFERKLAYGVVDPQVKQVQELLVKAGFYDGEYITDYFGNRTKEAVIAFQVEQGIIETKHSAGAGIVGPLTLKALNAVHYDENYSLPFEITDSIRAPAVHPDDLKFTKDIQHASRDLNI